MDTVLYEVRERVAWITLNRPHAMNALSVQLQADLTDAIVAARDDPEVDVLVVTGAGDRAFCAGLDLKELAEGRMRLADGDRRGGADLVGGFLHGIRLLEKPSIAAVNGYAVTGGFELALCCDIVVAAEHASFADTHARLGILPGGGMSAVLPALVGAKKAKEISLTGNFLSAQDAHRLGLVNHVVPLADLLPTAARLAADIVSNDQRAVRAMKRLIDYSVEGGVGAGIRHETETSRQQHTAIGADHVADRREAVQARNRASTA